MSEPVLPPADDAKKDAERRAEWDRISVQRQAMIDAEKEKAATREQANRDEAARGRSAFLEEATKITKDAIEREEWRQGQHQKRREEEETRRLKVLREEEEKKKKEQREQEEKERKEYLDNLHEASVKKRVDAKKASINNETEKQVRAADDIAIRDSGTLDAETARALKHVEGDTKKKSDAARADSERRKALASNKLELMAIDDALEKKLMDLAQEASHLKAEIVRHHNEKKQSIQKQADRKKFDANKRKESFEHWLETGN